jgi:endonuclease/exonuclease/phosphatase family metal-dependent hydrolase
MCWGLYEKEGYKESVVVFCCHLPHVGMCRTYKSEGGFCWQCSDCSLVQKLRASLSKAIADALSLMEPKPSSLILMGDFNELGEYIGGKFNSKKEWNRGQSFKVAGRFNLYSGERSDDGLFRLPTGYTTWNRRRISHPDRTFFGSIEEDFDLKTDVFRSDIKASDHFAVPCSMWRKR